MINNAAFPPVGILGLGFLGQILAREFSAVPESWGTWHLTPPQEPILSNFSFDWANENNWSALPETASNTRADHSSSAEESENGSGAPAPLVQVDQQIVRK